MRKIIIILLLIIILGATGWYFYNKSKINSPTREQASGFKSFFSFGNTKINTPDGNLNQETQGGDIVPEKVVSRFKQLSPHQVAGYSLFKTTTTINVDSTNPKVKPTKETIVDHVVRYVSRTNGYVYEMKNGGSPIQVSNISIPNIYEAKFAENGKTAILRFLRDDNKTIATYSVPIPEPNVDGTRTQKSGVYLPDNISNMAVSPDGVTVAKIKTEGSSAVLSTTTTANTGKKELLRSPFHEWLVSFGTKNDVYLQSKASASAPGYLYLVDQTKKRLVRTIGNVAGLTTSVSPNNTYILYSQSTQNGFTAKIMTVKTGAIRAVGDSILPEKCTWLKNEDLICAGGGTLPNGNYPDDWYQGTVAFSDKLFRFYTQTMTFDVLSEPNETESFDMTNLQVDEDSNILYFINKQTGIFWQFTL